MSRDDISTPQGLRLFVGLSAIIQVAVTAGQNAIILKGLSFSNLEIGGASLTWGQGYPFSVGEILSWNSAANFYLAASGSTATVAIFKGRSSGFEE